MAAVNRRDREVSESSECEEKTEDSFNVTECVSSNTQFYVYTCTNIRHMMLHLSVWRKACCRWAVVNCRMRNATVRVRVRYKVRVGVMEGVSSWVTARVTFHSNILHSKVYP